MNLRSPQPNQTFFHVPPVGNTYTSDGTNLITPLTADDAAALRALGCVDAEPTSDAPIMPVTSIFDEVVHDQEDEPVAEDESRL